MAYEYDHDCPFEAFITNLGKYNEGELVGEWVKFPTTSEELQKVFERIGIGSKDDFGNPYEEWFISDYDCYVDGLYEKLGEYENLDELNYLASKLDELDDHDYNHFQAAMQISDYTGSIKDVINLIDNLDKYEIYPGVQSFIVQFLMYVLSAVIFVIINGRMVEIYLMVSLAPLPFATFGNREQSMMGQNYMRSLFALGFQGFLIMVCVGIYAVLIQSVAFSTDIIASLWKVMGFTILLAFTLFKTGAVAHSIFHAH